MGLTAEQIVDLGRWPVIYFGSPKAREAAIERYQRYLERQAVQP